MIKKYLKCAAIALIVMTMNCGARAQVEAKPIRLAVGFGAGGSTDVIARIIGQKMSETLGQPVIVDNKVGAAGSIAADFVAKGDPDGSRILLIASGTFVYSVLSKNVPYDVLKDFTPISYVAYAPLILVVNPALPVRSVSELVQLARAKPGELNYGSEGIGGSSHLAAELFSQVTNTKLVHVPFKGAVESTMGTAAGQVTINFPTVTSALPLLKSERLRPLAVSSLKRSALYPSVPTLDELGMKGFDQVAWFGFMGPAKMPRELVEKLRGVIVAAASTPEVKDALAKQGVEVQIRSPEQFSSFMRESAAQITKLAKDANIKME